MPRKVQRQRRNDRPRRLRHRRRLTRWWRRHVLVLCACFIYVLIANEMKRPEPESIRGQSKISMCLVPLDLLQHACCCVALVSLARGSPRPRERYADTPIRRYADMQRNPVVAERFQDDKSNLQSAQARSLCTLSSCLGRRD